LMSRKDSLSFIFRGWAAPKSMGITQPSDLTVHSTNSSQRRRDYTDSDHPKTSNYVPQQHRQSRSGYNLRTTDF
jgi:hypothetical protein